MTVEEPEQDLNSPREECGVFGVWAPGEEVAKLTYYGHGGRNAESVARVGGRKNGFLTLNLQFRVIFS